MVPAGFEDDAIRLRYPLAPPFLVRNSPADRVPSHGTDLLGTTYAIDLLPVDGRGRTAPPNLRALLTTEDARTFVGFGVPVLAPSEGEVVVAHDAEPDHEARRSPVGLLRYALGQPARVRRGAGAIAGNHVVVAMGGTGPFVLLAHLRRGSLLVRVGDRVRVGQQVAACGNSGNSTQPHVHVQVTDSTDWPTARGLPMVFEGRRGVELPAGGRIVTATGTDPA